MLKSKLCFCDFLLLPSWGGLESLKVKLPKNMASSLPGYLWPFTYNLDDLLAVLLDDLLMVSLVRR